MIDIDNKVLSRELFTKKFVCELSSCKGACCVEGDSGAPLEKGEPEILETELPNILPYLNEAGIKAIKEQGPYVTDKLDGELVTPLVNNKECAYTIFDDDGTAKCGIEKAYRDGKTTFHKPISCHLYPIRVTKFQKFEAVNYNHWDICSPARTCGADLNMKVFRFLKEPIIRKYGKEFYEKMKIIDKEFFADKI